MTGDDARKARELAAEMDEWLADSGELNVTWFASSDLVEWCRSARDVLERIGKTGRRRNSAAASVAARERSRR